MQSCMAAIVFHAAKGEFAEGDGLSASSPFTICGISQAGFIQPAGAGWIDYREAQIGIASKRLDSLAWLKPRSA